MNDNVNSCVIKIIIMDSSKLTDDYAFQLLHEAMKTSNLPSIERLVGSGAIDPNAWYDGLGAAPIHLSVGYGPECEATDMTHVLLKHGADANVADVEGLTPVHVAASWDRTRVLHLLLLHGGDPWRQDHDHLNAFNHAFQAKAWASIDLLHQFQLSLGGLRKKCCSLAVSPVQVREYIPTKSEENLLSPTTTCCKSKTNGRHKSNQRKGKLVWFEESYGVDSGKDEPDSLIDVTDELIGDDSFCDVMNVNSQLLTRELCEFDERELSVDEIRVSLAEIGYRSSYGDGAAPQPIPQRPIDFDHFKMTDSCDKQKNYPHGLPNEKKTDDFRLYKDYQPQNIPILVDNKLPSNVDQLKMTDTCDNQKNFSLGMRNERRTDDCGVINNSLSQNNAITEQVDNELLINFDQLKMTDTCDNQKNFPLGMRKRTDDCGVVHNSLSQNNAITEQVDNKLPINFDPLKLTESCDKHYAIATLPDSIDVKPKVEPNEPLPLKHGKNSSVIEMNRTYNVCDGELFAELKAAVNERALRMSGVHILPQLSPKSPGVKNVDEANVKQTRRQVILKPTDTPSFTSELTLNLSPKTTKTEVTPVRGHTLKEQLERMKTPSPAVSVRVVSSSGKNVLNNRINKELKDLTNQLHRKHVNKRSDSPTLNDIDRNTAFRILIPKIDNNLYKVDGDDDPLLTDFSSSEDSCSFVSCVDSLGDSREMTEDDKMRSELASYGLEPGPITGSTRSLYTRLLARYRTLGPPHRPSRHSPLQRKVDNRPARPLPQTSRTVHIEPRPFKSHREVDNRPARPLPQTSRTVHIEPRPFKSHREVGNRPAQPLPQTSRTVHIEPRPFKSHREDHNRPARPLPHTSRTVHIGPRPSQSQIAADHNPGRLLESVVGRDSSYGRLFYPQYNVPGNYCPELNSDLDNPSCPYQQFEESMDFGPLNVNGGGNKTHFNYLLLDQRISNNLPQRRSVLTSGEINRQFLQAVFYIGKGKAGRPYQHLKEALTLYKGRQYPNKPKESQILDIWNCGYGVVCLHVFHNILEVEALTREAAMIDALGLANLRNQQAGTYHGAVAHWSNENKRRLGVRLLYKARDNLLNDGERAIGPTDI